MIISSKLAQPIVDEVMHVVDYNINIMNEHGVIVASGDPDRLNEIHQGAVEVIESNREIKIYPSDSNHLIGTKAGVNLPIQMQGKTIGVVGITGHPDLVYPVARIVKVTVESLLMQKYLGEQVQYRQRAIESWGMDLINPENENIDDLEMRAHFLRINTRNTCAVMVVHVDGLLPEHSDPGADDPFGETQRQIARIQELLGMYLASAPFIFYSGRGHFVAGIAAEGSHHEEEAGKIAGHIHARLKKDRIESFIGIGHAASGVAGYRDSYLEAVQSVEIMKKVNPRKAVAHIREWGILHLIHQIPEHVRNNYVARFLSGKRQLDPELYQTLEVFMNSDLNIGLAAERLFIHRNTLLYRLDKIRNEWGVDPKNFSDAFMLKFILLSEKLRTQPGQAGLATRGA